MFRALTAALRRRHRDAPSGPAGEPPSLILLPGDRVIFTLDGATATGVIEGFEYDTDAWARGVNLDVAVVRLESGGVARPLVAEIGGLA
jgi:hypothetical protein